MVIKIKFRMKISSYTKKDIKNYSRREKPKVVYVRVIKNTQRVLRKMLDNITMIRLKNQYYEIQENYSKK